MTTMRSSILAVLLIAIFVTSLVQAQKLIQSQTVLRGRNLNIQEELKNLQPYQETDGTLPLNIFGASETFDLPQYDGTAATSQSYSFDVDPITAGTAVSCAATGCSVSTGTDLVLLLSGRNATNYATSVACDTKVYLTFPIDSPASENRVTMWSSGGPTTSVTLTCISCVTSSCFSGETIVQVQQKGTVQMKDLQVNDNVLIGTDSNQKPIYQPIYAFGHHDKDTPTAYLQVHTTTNSNSNDPLEISAAHLLFMEGKEHPVRADSIQEGDVLIYQSRIAQVTRINTVVKNGAYMPLTKSGTIVVNGVLASTYVSIMDHAPAVVGKYLNIVSEDQLLHWWLAPYRMVCDGLPIICENDKDIEGISYWLVFGRYLARLGNGWGLLGQLLGVTVVGLVIASFVAVETLFGLVAFVPLSFSGFALVWAGTSHRRVQSMRTKIE